MINRALKYGLYLLAYEDIISLERKWENFNNKNTLTENEVKFLEENTGKSTRITDPKNKTYHYEQIEQIEQKTIKKGNYEYRINKSDGKNNNPLYNLQRMCHYDNSHIFNRANALGWSLKKHTWSPKVGRNKENTALAFNTLRKNSDCPEDLHLETNNCGKIPEKYLPNPPPKYVHALQNNIKNQKALVVFAGNLERANDIIYSYSDLAKEHNLDLVVVDYLGYVSTLDEKTYTIKNVTDFGKSALEWVASEYDGIENCCVYGNSSGGFNALQAIDAYEKDYPTQYPYFIGERTLTNPINFYRAFPTFRWLVKYCFVGKENRCEDASNIYSRIPENKRMSLCALGDNVISYTARLHRGRKGIVNNDYTMHVLSSKEDDKKYSQHGIDLRYLYSENNISGEKIVNGFLSKFSKNLSVEANNRKIKSHNDTSQHCQA